jgi:hypothetical protein
MTRRMLFALLLIVVVSSVFGCAGARQVYTQSEELEIVKKMSSQGKSMLYLYSRPNEGLYKMENNPFFCTVDNVDIGALLPGEYVLRRLDAGKHEISCNKTNAGAMGIPKRVEKKLMFEAGAEPVYMRVLDGATVYSDLVIEKTNRPDNFSDAYRLGQACTECSKP